MCASSIIVTCIEYVKRPNGGLLSTPSPGCAVISQRARTHHYNKCQVEQEQQAHKPARLPALQRLDGVSCRHSFVKTLDIKTKNRFGISRHGVPPCNNTLYRLFVS